MGDMGEKTCPLCAEEMDLTDQQLKPCGCGYEICVWCWHHLMDMAEKDDTEGRCPACRTPYDKEKIVGMAACCERVVTEINIEKKKSQKVKPKPSDGRKQLSTMRVIQRNLVYIVGLPFNLADEDLLQGKEYFGQYGKVLKVSMSRTAGGVVQQFPNNTCSVYITYAKEEEAIRCIQSVHGFILDDRCLKACFGTTKYCHAWLRNVPCNNADCVYLHEVGSQEDSYSKDEVISAYTRSRVPQIADPTNYVLQRTGSKLPPPVDDYCSSTTSSAVKPLKKSASTNSASISSSPLGVAAGRSLALPAGAAWGLRAPSQPQMLSNRPSKPKAATVGGSLSTVTSTVLGVLHNDAEKNVTWTDVNHVMNMSRHNLAVDYQAPTQEKPTITDSIATVTSSSSCLPASKSTDVGTNNPTAINSSINIGQLCSSEKEGNLTTDDTIQHLSSDLTSLRVDNDVLNELSGSFRTSSSLSDHCMVEPHMRQVLLQPYAKDCLEPLNPSVSNNNIAVMNGFCVSMERDNQQTETHIQTHTDSIPKVDDDIDSFNNQKIKDPEVLGCGKSLFNSSSIHSANHYRSQPLQHGDPFGSVTGNSDPLLSHNRLHDPSLVSSNSFLSNLNGISGGIDRVTDHSFSIGHEMEGNHLGRLQRGAATLDAGESSVISNILSLDLGKWEESLTSPQNLVRLLGETDNQPCLKTSTSWKSQNSNQSRFSFARQGESGNQSCDITGTYDIFGHASENRLLRQEVYDNRNSFLDQTGVGNSLASGNFDESDIFGSSFNPASCYKPSVSRAQISPPPGFTTTNRAPPPGFSQQEQIDQAYAAVADKHYSDLSHVRNSHQSVNVNPRLAGDFEFMDPAILAVGEGRLQASLSNPVLDMESNFLQQMSALENEARLQLLMQRSLSSLQNQRYSEDENTFASIGYSRGIPAKLFNQPQSSNVSLFDQASHQDPVNGFLSNGHFNGWNDVQGANILNMAELLRNEKLGLSQLYGSIYEDSRFQMPSSSNYV